MRVRSNLVQWHDNCTSLSMQHLVIVEVGATLPENFATLSPNVSIVVQSPQESSERLRARLEERLLRSDARPLTSIELVCNGSWAPGCTEQRRRLLRVAMLHHTAPAAPGVLQLPAVRHVTLRANLYEAADQQEVLRLIDLLSSELASVAFDVQLDLIRSGIRHERPTPSGSCREDAPELTTGLSDLNSTFPAPALLPVSRHR